MKKIPYWMVLLLFGSATLLQCTDSDEHVAPEKVQFTLSFKDTHAADGRAQLGNIPDALLLSLEKSNGESVFLNKRVTLLRMGDSFMTDPLELQPGHYKVTDFRLVAGESAVLFVTPRAGSVLSRVVNRPLPYAVTITKNKVTQVDMEVISVNDHDPEDFGYTSFVINTVNVLRLGVMSPQGSGINLTSAKAYIVEGTDTVKRYNVSATISLFSFPGDPQVSRKLVVKKPGHNTFVKEFVYNDLIASLNGSPWKVVLTPSLFTITPYLYPSMDNTYQMSLTGQSGNVTINWGDGTSQPFDLSGPNPSVEHQYATNGNFQINVTGDLGKIETFTTNYDFGAITALNLQGLTGLREISMGYQNTGPAVIDFTYNTMLESVSVHVVSNLKEVILPAESVVRFIDVSGPNQMQTADIDALIDQVYTGAAANHTLSGEFTLYSSIPPGSDRVGPPSTAAIDKLLELRDNYGWQILPGLE